MIEISGASSDGRPVVRGVYRMHETTGTPLDVILEGIRDRGMLPDWQSFVVEAVEAGMSLKRAIAKLEPAVADVFGPAMRDVVVLRLSTGIEKDEAWRKGRPLRPRALQDGILSRNRVEE